MVQTRSGRRTRLSDQSTANLKELQSTPIGSKRRAKKPRNVFEDEPKSEENTSKSSETIDEPATTESQVAKEASQDAVTANEESKMDQSEKDEDNTEENKQIVAEKEENVQHKEDVVSSQDNVEPIVSSNTEKESNEDSDNNEDDSDDEAPEVVTSKNIPVETDTEPTEAVPIISDYEKIMAKKAKKASQAIDRQEEKRIKKEMKRKSKKEARKLDDGIYQVKMKKSKAAFKVVTLKTGVSNILEPEINFREELLNARTLDCRVADTKKYQERKNWVSHSKF